MIFDTPLLPPNNCRKVSNDMSVAYPNLLTPPNDDNSLPYLETLQAPSSYNTINANFKRFTLDHNVLVEVPAPMLIDDISSDAYPTGDKPYLQIIEEPTDKFRFRYKSEMTGTHGSLNGMNNDKSRKVTYPTVQVVGIEEPAIVRCSIYQINAKDRDMMPHAHRLVRKTGNKEEVDDPHDLEVGPATNFQAVFKNMGIIHTAKKNIVGELVKKKTKLKKEQIAREEGRYRELNTREEVEIKGLAEIESKSINLNVVCLRFDAYYRQHDGILRPICPPLYSHGINNLKSALTGELKIVRMDHCTSPAKGGLEIFILVERVTKKNIKIRFFEVDESDVEVWEDYGKFSDLDVHHQYAIVFKTPPYKDKNITRPVKVFIELVRPSDNSRSEPKEFTYVPSSKDYRVGSKRPRMNDSFSSGSLSSGEIPQTIEDVNLSNLMTLNSEELQKAAQNIDSAEFEILYRNNLSEYLEPVDDINRPGYSKSVTIDAGTSSRSSSDSEKSVAMRTYSELREFLKTKPKKPAVIKMLNHYFGADDRTNALHIFIKKNMTMSAKSLIVLIEKFTPDLLNRKDGHGETPLCLATQRNNMNIVKYLISSGASLMIPNSDGTVLHNVASNTSVSSDIFEELLSSRQLEQCIDMENNDGDTPLALAINNVNHSAVRLLCKYGADINKTHNKNGFTPLRMAVETKDIELVRFILSHKDVDATIEDFSNISPVQAAMGNEEISRLIIDHLKSIGCNIDIKEEVNEDFSDEEMDCTGIKEEKDENCDDLESSYEKVKRFTDSCLNTVSALLDKSGNYQHLADLLELDHLLRSDLIHPGCSSPSKVLLSYAEQTETIYNIRNFLENLDEIEAVQVIDEMVKNLTS